MRQVRIYLTERMNSGREGASRTVSTAEELDAAFKELVAHTEKTGCKFFHYRFLEDGEEVGAGHYSHAEGWLAGKPLTGITRLP